MSVFEESPASCSSGPKVIGLRPILGAMFLVCSVTLSCTEDSVTKPRPSSTYPGYVDLLPGQARGIFRAEQDTYLPPGGSYANLSIEALPGTTVRVGPGVTIIDGGYMGTAGTIIVEGTKARPVVMGDNHINISAREGGRVEIRNGIFQGSIGVNIDHGRIRMEDCVIDTVLQFKSHYGELSLDGVDRFFGEGWNLHHTTLDATDSKVGFGLRSAVASLRFQSSEVTIRTGIYGSMSVLGPGDFVLEGSRLDIVNSSRLRLDSGVNLEIRDSFVRGGSITVASAIQPQIVRSRFENSRLELSRGNFLLDRIESEDTGWFLTGPGTVTQTSFLGESDVWLREVVNVQNCVFVGNNEGSKLDIDGEATVELSNCFIGKNCRIPFNRANDKVTVRNCILWDPNRSPHQTVGHDGWKFLFCDMDSVALALATRSADAVESCFSADPQFLPNTNFELSPNSPCRDSGDWNPRYTDTDGTRNDVGIWGGPGAPAQSEHR